MQQTSFSHKTKESLQTLQIKKGCCRKTFDNANAVFSSGNVSEINKKIASASEFWRCDGCAGCFMRAVFIHFGSVTDPSRRYHAELSFNDEKNARIIMQILSEAGYPPGIFTRKGKYVLYYKDSETIEDFLAFIGATGAVFDLMNSKIVKEVRNQTNRMVNCDTANIGKAVNSAGRYINIIREMKKNGLFNKLPSDLKMTADLRLEYHQMSMKELGEIHEPPISKSGVKHRLDKIINFSDINK